MECLSLIFFPFKYFGALFWDAEMLLGNSVTLRGLLLRSVRWDQHSVVVWVARWDPHTTDEVDLGHCLLP